MPFAPPKMLPFGGPDDEEPLSMPFGAETQTLRGMRRDLAPKHQVGRGIMNNTTAEEPGICEVGGEPRLWTDEDEDEVPVLGRTFWVGSGSSHWVQRMFSAWTCPTCASRLAPLHLPSPAPSPPMHWRSN